MTRHQWDPVCAPPGSLVRPVRVDPSGVSGPTRGQAQRGRWRRTSYGYYVPARVTSELPEQRIMEQSVRLPDGGAVTGWAACRMHRAGFFDGLLADRRTPIPVPLAIGQRSHIREDAAVSVSREPLHPDEVVVIDGVPCTRKIRALFDATRTAPDLRESVVAVDMMAAAEKVSINQLRGYTAERPGWRGAPLVRAALDLASERSKSPNETRTRHVWEIDAGFPRPLVNQPVWNRSGRLLGIADLLDPVAGVVGEFDGADHRGAVRHSKDVDREGGFRDHDLEFFRVTGLDLPKRPLVVARMESTRARALFLAEDQRPWTIDPPPGWEVEPTLDEILELRAFMASVYARQEREGDPDIQEVIRM